jgi:hypothetical protein
MRCPACQDTGHVCEDHPDRPWGPMCCDIGVLGREPCPHGACGCGAGAPCPRCCPAEPGQRITDAFQPRTT